MAEEPLPQFAKVVKTGGDYTFDGEIVAVFTKRPRNGKPGPWRYVVENGDGILHIFSGKQLSLVE